MRLSLCAALIALVACSRRAPSPTSTTPPALAALSSLRDALQRGELAGAVDPEALARAELLERLARLHDIQEDHQRGVTDDGWRRALAEIHAGSNPAGLRREFSQARALLGTGPCAETARTPLPEALSDVATMRPTWPAWVDAEVRAPIARRAANARAGDFRCEGGSGAFRAVFLPREEGEGLVVARLTAR